MSTKQYIRLPGSGRRGGILTLAVAVRRVRLWLGQDHLLVVDSQGHEEEYKRFYFRDIETIITRKTKTATVSNIVMVILIGFFGLMAWITGTDWIVLWGVLAGVIGLLLLINLLRGPSCTCQLRTAVHTEDLPSLNRVRTARRVIARLRPFIEQAQGALTITPEQLPQALFPTATTVAPVTAKPPSQLKHENGKVHLALFAVLLADGLVTYLHLFSHGMTTVLLGTTVTLTVMILTIIALVRQHHSDLPSSIRRLVLATLGCTCFFMLCGYVEALVITIQNPDMANNQLQMLRLYGAISPLESPWRTALYLVSIAISLGIGTTGLLLLRRFRKQSQPSVPPVTTG